jgi:hypothetical protein
MVSARNGNVEVPVCNLVVKQGYTVRKMKKDVMDILCIYKCRYEIQDQKEVPVWYTGICRPISSTDDGNKMQ